MLPKRTPISLMSQQLGLLLSHSCRSHTVTLETRQGALTQGPARASWQPEVDEEGEGGAPRLRVVPRLLQGGGQLGPDLGDLVGREGGERGDDIGSDRERGAMRGETVWEVERRKSGRRN